MPGAGEYSIRQFSAAGVEQYKSIRMEALQKEPGVFGSSYAREIAFTKEQWLDRLNNVSSACFGLYYGDELIGVTGIVFDKKEPGLAHMTQSYIRTMHRGKGLSHLLYDARIQWAKVKGIKVLRIGHRENNLRSKAANQQYGFKYSYRESINWPDGTVEDSLYYELRIN